MSVEAQHGDVERELEARLAGTPYDSYVYSYPHKTAYRSLEPARPLPEVWQDENRQALFLYVHVPFCEMRCGFCNLFTTPLPKQDLSAAYVDAIERQCRSVAAALPDARFARFAMGGGTPTFVELPALTRLMDRIAGLGVDLRKIPASVETSPETAEPDKLALLRDRGVDRISIGVQSFVEREAALVKRAQKNQRVAAALHDIRRAGFPTLNIDLIYGLPDQTPETWLQSLHAALEWRPEELYLYPLYVRPLTTLGRNPRSWDDQRLELYRLARELLLSRGYSQLSMRMFRASHAPDEEGPVYCVQDDGMLGLGCGARSYTRGLHYGNDYAVGARRVKEILGSWVQRSAEQFAEVDYGIELDAAEQRRRYVELSLFNGAVDRSAYRQRFGADLLRDLPELGLLEPRGLAQATETSFELSAHGLELSDTLGPWLFSPRVRRRMASFELG